ncbi:MAG: hypothetical protein WBP15_00025, partial [Tabrizicola sp.]
DQPFGPRQCHRQKQCHDGGKKNTHGRGLFQCPEPCGDGTRIALTKVKVTVPSLEQGPRSLTS